MTGFTRSAVERLSTVKNEPSWVLDARLAAYDTFESIAWPKRTDE
ncbi:MAG: hypothetical protein QOF73_3265, partial [Thermomicrobiales bacterium]|nr:hypothetical protein [Thermomicrobiales bacterium]